MTESATAPRLFRAPTKPRDPPSSNWIIATLLFQFACQLALLSSVFAPMRVFFRTASFGVSLGMFALLPGKNRLQHPSTFLLIISVAIVALGFVNPTTNSFLAGVATTVFYLAVASPAFWVTRLRVTRSDFRNLIMVIWGFQTVSAAFGALQVYFPGSFQPAFASNLGESYVQGLQISLANGDTTFRPMGLTDTPGGACQAGFYSALLGFGLLLERRRALMRFLAVGGMVLGLFVLYLCQVRATLIMLSVCVVAMLLTLVAQGRAGRATGMLLIIALVGVAAAGFALSVGGDSTFDRLRKLGEDGAVDAYQSNRGIFLTDTFVNLLPQYPFGAGLGRWGPLAAYFADMSRAEGRPLWAEIQWTGWLYDGGVALMVAYPLAVLSSLLFSIRVATGRIASSDPFLATWAIVVVGYDVGAFALTFSYATFMSSFGLEFWLINAAFFSYVIGVARAPRPVDRAAAARARKRALMERFSRPRPRARSVMSGDAGPVG